MASKRVKKNSGPGNPAKQDPQVRKLFKTMEASVELVRDLKGSLSDEHYEWLRASSLGLMVTYSDITGLPSPMDYIEMDVAYSEKPPEKKDPCPICKDDAETAGHIQCFACGVDYAV